jgi:hypothetical protein|tara:strand:+ start:225 stop:524 length:300 start_codon:yes stop_codon:yes gene_type:complete
MLDQKDHTHDAVLDNDYDALVLALQLAISAPDDEKADRAVQMAQDFAKNLPEKEVARARFEALDKPFLPSIKLEEDYVDGNDDDWIDDLPDGVIVDWED